MNLPAVELAIQSNHYCHAQKDAGSHPDPKKQTARRKLYVASTICLLFMIGEIIGKAMGELTSDQCRDPEPSVCLSGLKSLTSVQNWGS